MSNLPKPPRVAVGIEPGKLASIREIIMNESHVRQPTGEGADHV